jgi:hypothetical protein
MTKNKTEDTTDGAIMTAWLREAANELDTAHTVLDTYGVPRRIDHDGRNAECTLAARITLALGARNANGQAH